MCQPTQRTRIFGCSPIEADGGVSNGYARRRAGRPTSPTSSRRRSGRRGPERRPTRRRRGRPRARGERATPRPGDGLRSDCTTSTSRNWRPTGSSSTIRRTASSGTARTSGSRRCWRHFPSKLPRPTRSLTRCARSLLESGAFRGLSHLPSRSHAGRGVDARRQFAGGSVRPGLATPHRLPRRMREGRPGNGVVGSFDFNSRWTQTDTVAVQGRILDPESGPVYGGPCIGSVFGSDTLPCDTVPRLKAVGNALSPQPTHSLRSFVEAGASALPCNETRERRGRNRRLRRGYAPSAGRAVTDPSLRTVTS